MLGIFGLSLGLCIHWRCEGFLLWLVSYKSATEQHQLYLVCLKLVKEVERMCIALILMQTSTHRSWLAHIALQLATVTIILHIIFRVIPNNAITYNDTINVILP